MRADWTRTRALIAIAVALSALAACSDDGDAPSKNPPAQSTPAAKTQLLWKSAPYNSPLAVGEVQARGDDILAITPTSTTLLDDRGTPVWTVKEPKRLGDTDYWLVVKDDVVRYSQRFDDGFRSRVRVLNGASGDLRWTRNNLANLIASDDTLLATACRPERVACEVVALESSTGRVVWKQPIAGAADLETSGNNLVVTSYPDGSVIGPDRYAALTQVDVLDVRTGKKLAATQRGKSFTLAGEVLIEHSYTGTSGRSCKLTLIARSLAGKELWTRSVAWTRAKADVDCAYAPLLSDTGEGLELTGVPRQQQRFEAKSGKTLRPLDDRLVERVGDLEVRATDDLTRVVDSSGATLWESLDDRPVRTIDDEVLALLAGGDDGGTVLRDIETGDVVLDLPGTFAGAGDDWIAVNSHGKGIGGVPHRLVLFAWPH